MGIVSKVRTLGMQNPALITSTLFGRCSTAANVAEKVVTISNDSFLESALMDGMSLRVFFEYGNTCDAPTLIIKNSNSITFNDTDIIKKEKEKAYNKYSKKYSGYELDLKVKSYLYRKGFNIGDMYEE